MSLRAGSVLRETLVTYRQLGYWQEIGLVWPTQPAGGKGHAAGFDPEDVAWVQVVSEAVEVGLQPSAIRDGIGRVGAKGYAQELRKVAQAIEKSCPDWLDGGITRL